MPISAVDVILERALHEESLDRESILYLLGLRETEEIRKIFTVAQILRRRYFEDKIFLYGFLYFSSWCRNNCRFCYYRASNRLCNRYRKTDNQVIEAALQMVDTGVHLLDLTMGEDPDFYDKESGFESLLQLIRDTKRQVSLPIMISPGVVPDQVLKELSKAGVEWYACYQETHNRELFSKLRLGQSYNDRLSKKYKAASLGLLVEEGLLSGVGESLDDIVDSMEEMAKMRAPQVRIMNFVPQKGTPMQSSPPPPRRRELLVIAVLRLLFPHRLIPASLDVYGIDGLREKLEAGANVVTSLVLPSSGMSGVAQSSLDISEGHRTGKGITPTLNELGLTKAEPDDYVSWIDKERKRLLQNNISTCPLEVEVLA